MFCSFKAYGRLSIVVIRRRIREQPKLTRRERERQRIDDAYSGPLGWLLLGLVLVFILLYPLAVKVAHCWDAAERQPIVFGHEKR